MSAKVRPIPEGYHSITPQLTCRDAARAIDFYKEALGAKEIMRMAGPGGKVMHAELQIGDSRFMIGDEFPGMSVAPAQSTLHSSSLFVYTEDVDTTFNRALKAGARAYLLKNMLHKELLDTIRAVQAGRKSLSAEVSYQLAEHATDDALTPGELSVLRLIADGNANKQIAAQLSLSEETVKGRVRNILSKLGANDRTHAAMIGIKRGIIEF